MRPHDVYVRRTVAEETELQAHDAQVLERIERLLFGHEEAALKAAPAVTQERNYIGIGVKVEGATNLTELVLDRPACADLGDRVGRRPVLEEEFERDSQTVRHLGQQTMQLANMEFD